MALVLLRLFEEKPERWEAVRWLNGPKQGKGQPFEKYLRNWCDAAPDRHKAFIRKLAGLYGISLPDSEAEAEGEVADAGDGGDATAKPPVFPKGYLIVLIVCLASAVFKHTVGKI